MKKSFRSFAVLLYVAVAGCSAHGGGTRSTALQPPGAQRLAADLRARGLRVLWANPIQSAVFKVPGSVYTVDGDDLQVFAYSNESDAAADASRVSPTGGTVGTSAIAWIAPPHIFRKGSMIVIYLGSQARIRDALAAELGRQIAGAD